MHANTAANGSGLDQAERVSQVCCAVVRCWRLCKMGAECQTRTTTNDEAGWRKVEGFKRCNQPGRGLTVWHH